MKILVTGTEGYLGCLLAPGARSRAATTSSASTPASTRAGWLYGGVDRDRR